MAAGVKKTSPAPQFPPRLSALVEIDSAGGVLVIHADDPWLIRSLKSDIRTEAVADKAEFVRFDCEETKDAVKESVALSRELGFFCQRRIILLEGADSLSETERKLLLAYIEKPEPNNLLIVCFIEIDKRTTFFKTLEKRREIYKRLPFPSEDELKAYIAERMAPVAVDREILSFFLKKENQDLSFIDTELEKLKLFAESTGRKKIAFAEAADLLAALSEEAIFRIMNLLMNGDAAGAIRFYRDLKALEGEQKVHPVLLTLLFRHFRAILTGHYMQAVTKKAEYESWLMSNKIFHLKFGWQKALARCSADMAEEALTELARIEFGMKGLRGVALADAGIALESFMAQRFR